MRARGNRQSSESRAPCLRLERVPRQRFEIRSRERPAQEPAELSAAVDVGRRGDDAEEPPARAKALREPGEDVEAPRGDATQEIQVFRGQRDEGNAAVRRGTENGVGPILEEIERCREDLRSRSNVAADEDRVAAELRGLTRRILQPAPERAPALLEKRDTGRAPIADPPQDAT